MTIDQTRALINSLKKKTHNNEAKWSTTSRKTEFKLSLSQGSVTIDKWTDSSGSFCDITIYDKNGVNIDRVVYNRSSSIFSELSDLIDLVRRKYYKVDETIDVFIKELDKEGNVGKINKDDDLPF